jgi:hypothetical protein
MERILLVEPNYKAKYPPIGLMKISTYFKRKGDYVEFHKGLMPKARVSEFDKVLITTLFTFDFDVCIKTIKYYIAIVGVENVYVGGIVATIMPRKFTGEIPGLQLIVRQLVTSRDLGYSDNQNIDLLELDYDMLWDIQYEYTMSDSYFIYTTRGCPRECTFCAVKTLEPKFYDCNNIKEQIERVNERFGIKKQLLIMDNNILYSKLFDDSVNTLKELGFGRGDNKIHKCNLMKYYLDSLSERIATGKTYVALLGRIKKVFRELKFNRIRKRDSEILHFILSAIDLESDESLAIMLLREQEFIKHFFERYNFHKITRYVDFNQGLDARLFFEEKAQKLSELAVKPCRIAFDSLDDIDDYNRAMEGALKHGIKHFSNYLLYNYNEKPGDLWTRLKVNIDFCKEYSSESISLFSFPMKYASIEHTDRSYVGRWWNKKYLQAINVILNVTSGVVAKEEDFFLRAYGEDESEFLEILSMPDDFIRYREFFERYGLIQLWKNSFRKLEKGEKEELIRILENSFDNGEVLYQDYGEKLNQIVYFYTLSKKKIENNTRYYLVEIEQAEKKSAITS